ncbi:MAG: TonB-dependent receptor [Deltaproteobacteria bacterium]|nr:TonB-dependent receptor [Deltaproteobacteria bacterium]
MEQKAKFVRALVVSIALLIVFPPLTSWAQSEESKDYEEYTLGEIVNIGTGAAVRDIAIINEVTPEDFEAVNADSVADILTYVPGVQVTYGRKFFPRITIHGFDQNRIATLIDGVPYYEAKYGGMDLNQIGLEGVARIDVVKGAASVLYGPNALGGVVNIITKKPTEKPFLSATVEYGVDGLDDAYKASLSHGMKKGNFNYWLSYSHREWDSWDLSDDFEPREGQIRSFPGGPPVTRNVVIEDGGERLNSDYKTDNFWAKVGVEPSESTEVYLNFHYITTEKGDTPNLDRVNVFSDFSQFAKISAYDDWGVDLSGKHALTDQFSMQAKFYYHTHEDNYTSFDDETYSQILAVSAYKDYIIGGMLLGDYKPVDWDTLRFSIHYKGDSHEQRDLESLPFAKSFAYTGSIGLENELSWFNKKLSVVAGISYDWFDITKDEEDPDNDGNIIDSGTPDKTDEFNPMIGATYQVSDDVKLFASVAKKSRFPTLSQIYAGDTPNLELEAEKSINYTAGVSWAIRNLFKVEVAPFFHDISDFITRDVPPTENPFSQYKNYEEVEFLGVEVNAEITLFKDLLFKVGFMYNDAGNKSSGRVTDDVLNVPESTFNFGVQYIVPTIGTKLNWTMLFMGKSYQQLPTPDDPTLEVVENENYTLCNARIAQPFMSDHLEAFFSVDNLLDEDYEPNSGQPAPGRRMWLGLTYKY